MRLDQKLRLPNEHEATQVEKPHPFVLEGSNEEPPGTTPVNLTSSRSPAKAKLLPPATHPFELFDVRSEGGKK